MTTQREWRNCVNRAWNYAIFYQHSKKATWWGREHDRQLTRTPLAWANEKFFTDNVDVWYAHFPHVSEKNPTLLAYTQNNEKGERDIQTPVRPGKYLREYFSHILSEKQIAYYAEWFAKGVQPKTEWHDYALKFALDPDDIARVYILGPFSCMDGRNFSTSAHPCRAYGAGDLGVAYLEGAGTTGRKAGKITARSVVWPEKKIFGRLYPNPDFYNEDGFRSTTASRACANALEEKLRAEGYRSTREGGSFEGARLLKIPKAHTLDGRSTKNGFLLPYVDGDCHWLRDEGEHFTLNTSGDWAARNQYGVVECVYPHHCGMCGKGCSYANIGAVVVSWNRIGLFFQESWWCAECRAQHTYTCHGDDRVYSNDVEKIVSARGTVYCWRNAPAKLKAVRDAGGVEALLARAAAVEARPAEPDQPSWLSPPRVEAEVPAPTLPSWTCTPLPTEFAWPLEEISQQINALENIIRRNNP